MKITAHKYWAFENSYSGDAFNFNHIGMSKGRTILWVKEYLREHPMPKDDAYREDELIDDLAYPAKMYAVDVRAKQETIDYILEMLNELCSQEKDEAK